MCFNIEYWWIINLHSKTLNSGSGDIISSALWSSETVFIITSQQSKNAIRCTRVQYAEMLIGSIKCKSDWHALAILRSWVVVFSGRMLIKLETQFGDKYKTCPGLQTKLSGRSIFSIIIRYNWASIKSWRHHSKVLNSLLLFPKKCWPRFNFNWPNAESY